MGIRAVITVDKTQRGDLAERLEEATGRRISMNNIGGGQCSMKIDERSGSVRGTVEAMLRQSGFPHTFDEEAE